MCVDVCTWSNLAQKQCMDVHVCTRSQTHETLPYLDIDVEKAAHEAHSQLLPPPSPDEADSSAMTETEHPPTHFAPNRNQQTRQNTTHKSSIRKSGAIHPSPDNKKQRQRGRKQVSAWCNHKIIPGVGTSAT